MVLVEATVFFGFDIVIKKRSGIGISKIVGIGTALTILTASCKSSK